MSARHLHATALTMAEALDAAERVADDLVDLAASQLVIPAEHVEFLARRLQALTRGIRHADTRQPTDVAQ